MNTLNNLTDLVKNDLEFAKENAHLSSTMECFHYQKEYWNGKVEALEKVMETLNKTKEVVSGLDKKKKSFFNFFK